MYGLVCGRAQALRQDADGCSHDEAGHHDLDIVVLLVAEGMDATAQANNNPSEAPRITPKGTEWVLRATIPQMMPTTRPLKKSNQSGCS